LKIDKTNSNESSPLTASKGNYNPSARIKEVQFLKRKQLRPAYKKEILKQYDVQRKFFDPASLESKDREKMLEIAKQLVMRRVIGGYAIWKTQFPVIVTDIRPKILICAERLVMEFSKNIAGKTKNSKEKFRNYLGWVWFDYATLNDYQNSNSKAIAKISPSETVKLGTTKITYAQHFLLSSPEKHLGNYKMNDIGRYHEIKDSLKNAIKLDSEPNKKREKALGKLMLRYMQTGEPVKVEDLINICGPWWKCLANVGGDKGSQEKVDKSISDAIKQGMFTGTDLREIMTDNGVSPVIELENFKRFLRGLFPALKETRNGGDFLKFVNGIFEDSTDGRNTSIALAELWMKTPEEWGKVKDEGLLRILKRAPNNKDVTSSLNLPKDYFSTNIDDRQKLYDNFYKDHTANKDAFYGKAAEDFCLEYLKRQVDSLNRIFYNVCVKEIARYMCADEKKYNVPGAFAQERSIQLLAAGKLTVDDVFNTKAIYGPLTVGGWGNEHIKRQYAVNRKYDKKNIHSDKQKRHNPEQDNDVITSYAKLTKELKDAFGDGSLKRKHENNENSNDSGKNIKKKKLNESKKEKDEKIIITNNKIENQNEFKNENGNTKKLASNDSEMDDIEPTEPQTPTGLENMFKNVFNSGWNEMGKRVPDFDPKKLKTVQK
jgi:hypothetical protein